MGSGPLVCLIIEPSDENLRSASQLLKEEGFRVVEVDRGRKGLEAAEREELSIILLNLELPDESGYDVCRTIRRTYYQRPLQIILTSANWDMDLLSKSIDAGVDDIIRNPIDPDELRLRAHAARVRFEGQSQVYGEREFYRNAVKQEEELSSRVLDQNLNLKRAYQSIELANQELERSNRELQRVARYDTLSGLMSRLSIFNMIDVEVDRATRTGAPLCGIMVDVDHFKTINDNYGHQCGDSVIRMIGEVLRNELRKYDHAGRYGGEEFFVLLPNTTLQQARRFGDRFRRTLESSTAICTDASARVTASAGIAQFRSGESREMWISRADRALYAAKQNGRNRVETETILAF